jgi:hypothetical protein
MKMMYFRILSNPIFCGEIICSASSPYPPEHYGIVTLSIRPYGTTVQHPARPMPLPDPNIQHKAQCDPCVHISATNNINVSHLE